MAPTQSKPPGALTRQATSGGFMLQRQPTHAQLLASSVRMDDTDREIGANLWKQQRMLPPSSRFKHLWDYAMTVLVLYNFVLTPVQLGYYTARTLTESFGGLTALDGVIYLAFVLDLAINFRTTYYDDERQIVLDARLVAQRYLNTWFWWDFFGTLPLHLIGAAATLGTPTPFRVLIIALCKVPLCARLLRLGHKLSEISSVGVFRVLLQMFGFIMGAPPPRPPRASCARAPWPRGGRCAASLSLSIPLSLSLFPSLSLSLPHSLSLSVSLPTPRERTVAARSRALGGLHMVAHW